MPSLSCRSKSAGVLRPVNQCGYIRAIVLSKASINTTLWSCATEFCDVILAHPFTPRLKMEHISKQYWHFQGFSRLKLGDNSLKLPKDLGKVIAHATTRTWFFRSSDKGKKSVASLGEEVRVICVREVRITILQFYSWCHQSIHV